MRQALKNAADAYLRSRPNYNKRPVRDHHGTSNRPPPSFFKPNAPVAAYI